LDRSVFLCKRPPCPIGDSQTSTRRHTLGSVKSSAPEPARPVSPTACPFCRSTTISTPTDKTTASTYWRCDACGEMWNVSRQMASDRPSGRRWK
jgi:hypothetical protein